MNHARRIFQYSLTLIAPVRSVEIRVDARVRSFFAQTVRRGFAYGFSFNTHLAPRERKTRSRSRKVIFPLASLDRREPAGTAVSIGRLFNRKPGFSAVYLSVPCTQPYLADETKKKGGGEGVKLYRARGNSLFGIVGAREFASFSNKMPLGHVAAGIA